MNTRLLNVICLLLILGGAIWSAVLWHDGDIARATLVAVWAMLAPSILRALASL